VSGRRSGSRERRGRDKSVKRRLRSEQVFLGRGWRQATACVMELLFLVMPEEGDKFPSRCEESVGTGSQIGCVISISSFEICMAFVGALLHFGKLNRPVSPGGSTAGIK
jgi:hypothetical protein